MLGLYALRTLPSLNLLRVAGRSHLGALLLLAVHGVHSCSIVNFIELDLCKVLGQSSVLLLILRSRRIFSKSVTAHHLLLLDLHRPLLAIVLLLLRLSTQTIPIRPKHNIILPYNRRPRLPAALNSLRALVL